VRDRGTYGCSVPWSTPTVIQRPVVDGERKGVREVSAASLHQAVCHSQITRCRLSRQNIPHTLPAAAGRADPVDRSLTTLPH